MTYQQDDRQMFDVNVDCGECGVHISQLPFQPSGDRPVYCSNCLKARRNQRMQNRPQRQMFDVDVQCAECGKQITQLPFQPSGDRPIYCFDCNKSRRAAMAA